MNTFGWSATNPVYGGTGSGSLSGLYPTVTLLEGIKQAGIEYNEDLNKFTTTTLSKRLVTSLIMASSRVVGSR